MKINLMVNTPKTKSDKVWATISLVSGIVSGCATIVAAVINNRTQKKAAENNKAAKELIEVTVCKTIQELNDMNQEQEEEKDESNEA